MNAQIIPIADVNHRGTEILIRELGVVNTIRFLNQFRVGHGDYSVDRQELYADVTLDEIIQEL